MMGKWRYLHQHFVTVANYINCNIFVKIWYDSSVITTLLTTKLYQGLIYNGTWHTKLKFIFNKVITQHPIKGAAAKIVQYYQQNDSISYISCTNMSKMIFGSNDTQLCSFHSNKELVSSDLGRNGEFILYGLLG